MKKLITIIFLLANMSLFAQNTYVPDDNFEQALIDLGYDSGALDDYVPTSNISELTFLEVTNKNISDLTGIEDFTVLNDLRCSDNQLTSLDVSANTSLFNLSCYKNQLTSLDLSTNTSLFNLYCYENQLTNIDVSENTSLNLLHCYDNQLTNLDVTTNTSLNILYCYENQLTSLDVSENTSLTRLWCGENPLTSLNVSTNTSLTLLYCYENQLTSLNVTENTSLTSLACFSNQLTSLDVRNNNNANFEYFKSLNNPNLTCIYVDDATWSETNWINVDPASSFVETEVECDGLNPTYVPDDNFEQALIDLGYDDLLDDYVITANINGINLLNVNNKNISNLTGIEDFTALTYLNCSSNQLTSLNISENTSLTILSCSSNQLNGLNISTNTSLTFLDCFSNQLTNLDVRNNNNGNFINFHANANPNLTCILVDDATWSETNWKNIDATSIFVETEAECDILDINDIDNNNLAIFPNPAKDIFNIKTNNEIEIVNIYDILGKLIKSYNKQDNYSVSGLANGVYLIHVKSEDGLQVSKLVVE